MRAALLFVLVAASSACVTPTTLRADARGLSRVVLVSLHGTRDLGIVDTAPGPMALGDGIGEDAIGVLDGDTEGFLDGLFDDVVPLRAALAHKSYDLLPEALPPEDWTQVDRATAVDIDNPRVNEAMAAVARALDADAAVVVRHQWWLSRERYELVRYVSLYDRCSILVVDRDGAVVWRQTVMSRAPTRMMWGAQLTLGLGGVDVMNEARQLARETARA